MATIATRPVDDVCQSLQTIQRLPVVATAHTDERFVDDGRERVAVVVLKDGIERVPAAVCRAAGEEDFGIDSIERYPGHLEVVLQ